MMKPVSKKFKEVFHSKEAEKIESYDDRLEYAMDIALDEIFTAIQSMQTGISSDPRKDARALVRRMVGEIDGYGDGL